MDFVASLIQAFIQFGISSFLPTQCLRETILNIVLFFLVVKATTIIAIQKPTLRRQDSRKPKRACYAEKRPSQNPSARDDPNGSPPERLRPREVGLEEGLGFKFLGFLG